MSRKKAILLLAEQFMRSDAKANRLPLGDNP